jgi:L-lactate dehydrogenase complex protein LldG
VGATAPSIARRYWLVGEHAPGTPSVLALLVDRLADYKATVHVTDDVAGAVSTVLSSLGRPGPPTIVAPTGVPPPWLPVGVHAVEDGDPAALDAADAVLTGCAVAIAETGTIVLDGGERSGRRALTLVPDYHLCVVEAGSIVAGVPDAVAALAEAAAQGRPITLVSGPSATSDIELDRVEGVHGPRTLDVLVVG